MAGKAASTGWGKVREAQLRAVHEAVLQIVSEATTPVAVAEICARAGISRPTFYKYFPTVGAAVLQSFRIGFGQLTAAGRDRASSPSLGRSTLMHQYAARFQFAQEHPEIIRLISFLDYSYRRVGLSREESDEIERFGRSEGALEESLFRHGQADGSIRPDLDPRSTVATIGTSILGMTQRLMITQSSGGPPSPDVEMAFRSLLHAWDGFLDPAIRHDRSASVSPDD